MQCSECTELLQRRLDGENPAEPAALASHLRDCAACRGLHEAARRYEESLRGRQYQAPAEDMTARIVATVLHDRRQRRLRLRRQVFITAALAASILLMAVAGYVWLPNVKHKEDVAGPVVKDKEPAASPPLGPAVEKARDALTSLTSKLAEQTKEQAKVFLTAAGSLDFTPPMPALPVMDDPLEPATQSLRQATLGMGEGIQTVAGRTRQALTYFVKLAPLDLGTN